MFKHLIIHKVLNRKYPKKDRISLGYVTEYNTMQISILDILDKHMEPKCQYLGYLLLRSLGIISIFIFLLKK